MLELWRGAGAGIPRVSPVYVSFLSKLVILFPLYAKKYTKITKVTDLAKRKAKLKAEVEALQARASQPS